MAVTSYNTTKKNHIRDLKISGGTGARGEAVNGGAVRVLGGGGDCTVIQGDKEPVVVEPPSGYWTLDNLKVTWQCKRYSIVYWPSLYSLIKSASHVTKS